MLINKSSLLDPRVKLLVHLTEEEQIDTVDDLINEIVMEISPFPPDEPESEVIELQSSGQDQADQEQTSSGTSGEPVRKKCMSEKLLGDTFSSSHLDNSCHSFI